MANGLNFKVGGFALSEMNAETDGTLDIADTSVSAAPEPAAWALMMLGVNAIGAMLGYRKRILVDHKTKLAAIG